MFKLTTPCDNCPFRSDKVFYLRPARAAEISKSLVWGQSFHCHKTVHWLEGDEDEPDFDKKKAQMCAGAMIILARLDMPNQMMQICERLDLFDPSKLDMDAPVFGNFEEFIAAMIEREGG